MTFGIMADATPEQEAQIESLRARLDSRWGTDSAHWLAAAEMVMGGIIDDLRREAIAPLTEATEFQTTALAQVLAADVWDSHEGRSRDYADLSDLAQRVVRDRALRHLEALRRFLTR